MKIIDRYLLKSFWITFTSVFVILFFIFILQTVWLFISELAGKDLDTLMVIKFLLFAMPRIVPMVLPLSVLLASIMTFGSLAENYEFAAMKSSGISFQRSLKYLTYFILVLSVVSFFFANNVIPYAEYKFINFRRNIAQLKPALAIAEGQFSEIGNYSIKVMKKRGEKGNLLEGITIHRTIPNGGGTTTVIKAKSGELVSSEDSNTLKLVLHDGTYYEDVATNYETRNNIPFAKGTFKRDVFNIDLSKLNQESQNGLDLSNTFTMLNISELRYTLDSLNANYKKEALSYGENLATRSGIVSNTAGMSNFTKKMPSQDILAYLSQNQKVDVYRYAYSNVENIGFTIDSSLFEMEAKTKNINKHWIAIYDKFMIAFSCILMFFIGAPLGSIIRKGGIGLPIVFSVIIFIIFHFVNTFGKRLAQENGISPFLGVWLSTFILIPLAITLTYRAINDIGGMVTFDVITEPILKFFKRSKIEDLTTVSTLSHEESFETETELIDEELSVSEINQFENKTTTDVVEQSPVMEDISEIVEASLGNLNYDFIVKYNKKALSVYFGMVLLCSVLFFTPHFLVWGGALTLLLVLLFYVSKIQLHLMKNAPEMEPGLVISLLTAFPFYPIQFYLLKKQLNSKLLPNS
ncbi:LptF/LptG family permease [Flavobacterium stagni]|uniref:YjgP/YjgQ family permease n=1 Tax=Flavobacterium stagni TaxID=2506421 RepID=A0A4Q1K8P8_9FLAO|nr:LptF/LptG family permease [Flavobacterium stagni]RXR22806.1 YjgP/YjgQ family permease [Flavobacterium stagni]